VIIGIFLLVENISWANFSAAILLGVIANYSMANGLLYWLIGLVILFITTSKKMRIIKIPLWIIFSGICVGLFFNGWTSTGHFDFYYIPAHLLEWLIWMLNFLGAPIMTLWYVAWIFGSLSVSLYILVIGQAIRTGCWRALIPYFAIVFFILVSAFSISLGRMEMGMPQSVVPRYLTMSVWYWVSLLALLPLLNMKNLYQQVLYVLLTISLVFLTIGGGWRGYVSIHQRILPAYQAVISGQGIGDNVLAHISHDLDVARSRLEFLCENKLSACADMP
jgi:hypothetical protein